MIDLDPAMFDFELSHDEWVRFVFDHPVQFDGLPEWYWDLSFEFEYAWEAKVRPATKLQYATRLFGETARLPEQYTPEQIDQGWFLILGPTFLAIGPRLRDEQIPLRLREDCITAMLGVFRDLFTDYPDLHACWLWWDVVTAWTGHDPDFNNALLMTMSEVLQLPSLACQKSALHGLGHLAHPQRPNVIGRYLETNPDLDVGTVAYARAAQEGMVL